jgi:putative ABC transport system permease protein
MPDNMISYGTSIQSPSEQLQKVTIDYLYHTIKAPKPAVASHIRQLRIIRDLDGRRYSELKRQLPYFICVIFIIITLIGVFCMNMFETEYRRKEIGIRKIAGARTGEVVWMICRQYIPLVLISFALATPIAIYCGQKTLDYFADHADIHWWMIALSLAIVGAITLGTVALQSWRIARENPVNSIKTE